MDIDNFMTTESNWLRQEDLDKPRLYTIKGADVAKVGEDDRIVLHFEDSDDELITNKTNLSLLASFYGSTNTEDWEGKKVVLWRDENVMYAGKRVGGIRVRLPKGVNPVTKDGFEPDQDIPF